MEREAHEATTSETPGAPVVPESYCCSQPVSNAGEHTWPMHVPIPGPGTCPARTAPASWRWIQRWRLPSHLVVTARCPRPSPVPHPCPELVRHTAGEGPAHARSRQPGRTCPAQMAPSKQCLSSCSFDRAAAAATPRKDVRACMYGMRHPRTPCNSVRSCSSPLLLLTVLEPIYRQETDTPEMSTPRIAASRSLIASMEPAEQSSNCVRVY
eukprot:1158261-Pelagomonas_calceolata.AAC.7